MQLKQYSLKNLVDRCPSCKSGELTNYVAFYCKNCKKSCGVELSDSGKKIKHKEATIFTMMLVLGFLILSYFKNSIHDVEILIFFVLMLFCHYFSFRTEKRIRDENFMNYSVLEFEIFFRNEK